MPVITTAARCLEEAVRLGSIRRAAQSLYLSASAVNRHILNLEGEYGTALLERLPRGVVATEAGRLLVTNIGRWRAEHAQAAQELDRLRTQKHLRIAVGLNECIAVNVFPALLVALQSEPQDITLSITVGGSENLAGSLVAGRFDLIAAFNLPRSSDFWIVSTLDVPVGLVMRPDDPMATRPSITLAECVSRRIILVDESLTLRPVLDAALDIATAKPGFPVISNSIAVIKRSVMDRVGVSLLTLLDILPEWQQGLLAFVPLSEDVGESFSIALRDSREPAPAIAWVCDAIRDGVQKHLDAS